MHSEQTESWVPSEINSNGWVPSEVGYIVSDTLPDIIVILPQTAGTVNLYAQAMPYWFILSIACADEDDVTSISSYVFPGPNVP